MARTITSIRIAVTATLLTTVVPWAGAQNVAAPQLRQGDSWTYRETDSFTKLDRGMVITEVTQAVKPLQLATRTGDGRTLGSATVDGDGALVAGAINARAGGEMSPALALHPFPLTEGKRWSQTVRRYDPSLQSNRTVRISGRVHGWETVRVPAGEFKALRIERDMYLGDADAFRGESLRHETEWYAPELKAPVKLEVREHYREGGNVVGPFLQQDWYTRELVSFKGS